MTIGEKIKQRRKELGMTADELGERLGKNRSTIYRYENGEIEKMPIDFLKPIAEALRIDPNYFVEWKEATTEEKINSNANASITNRLLQDSTFNKVVKMLNQLEESQLEDVITLLNVSFKNCFNEDKK